VDLDLRDFPVTRYQGSKRKLIPWINEALIEKDVHFNTALDAFGGSGMVSFLFKKLGKNVTYNDTLKFNQIIGRAIIENSTTKLTMKEIQSILDFEAENNFIANNFSGIYFLDDENLFLDNLIAGIENQFPGNTKRNLFKKSIAYYGLFQACLIKRPFNLFHRKNLNLRTNDVERNFGNKTTWEKPFRDLFIKFVEEANNAIFDNFTSCKSTNQSAFEIDPYGYDLVYLDPPYFSQNGSHETADYRKCYHFLEGIANYSDWEAMIDFKTPNLRLKQNQGNDFQVGNIYDTFEELLVRYRDSIIVFSYKNGGLPGIDFIIKTMKKLKSNVYRKSIHYKYALNHQNGDAKKNREVLLIGY